LRILVTGAAGFIGSNLSARLAMSGCEVLGIDNFSTYYSPELKRLRVKRVLESHGVEIEEIDLTHLKLIHSLINRFQPQTVIHLAAQPGVRTPLEESDAYIQNNLISFSNVIQSSVQLGVPNFLYASSSSVYGNSVEFPYKEENKSIMPISIYGATKLANEILAPAYIAGSKTKARGMRFFTVYGPWGRPDMAYFRIIDSALNGNEFTKFGSGEVKRDFTFIDDITKMIESLANELGKREPGYSDIVNIGGGRPHSLNDLIEVITNQIDSKIDIAEIGRNRSDTNFTSADVGKLVELTGSKPKINLEEGVRRTIAWASHPEISDNLQKWAASTN
jgi:UDP-glucuronate 4-epimerase